LQWFRKMNVWNAYARFLKGSFMHVKRTNKRGVVKNTNENAILIADPARIPKFTSEQATKARDYTILMKNTEIWTRYTAPFHKSGDEPASNIDKVYRALWLPPNITFEKFILGQETLKHSNLLYEAMPFSTSSSLDAAKKYLKRGALKSPGYVAYIFEFYLQPNKDAYIDARASYIAHTLNFNQAGFEADLNDPNDQLNKQKEITLYPGQFVVSNIEKKEDDIKYDYITVKRRGIAWIIERGGLAGGSRRTRRNKTTRKTKRVRRSSRTVCGT
jgi:hypothetical protein